MKRFKKWPKNFQYLFLGKSLCFPWKSKCFEYNPVLKNLVWHHSVRCFFQYESFMHDEYWKMKSIDFKVNIWSTTLIQLSIMSWYMELTDIFFSPESTSFPQLRFTFDFWPRHHHFSSLSIWLLRHLFLPNSQEQLIRIIQSGSFVVLFLINIAIQPYNIECV